VSKSRVTPHDIEAARRVYARAIEIDDTKAREYAHATLLALVALAKEQR
jgi:hypothetical protein